MPSMSLPLLADLNSRYRNSKNSTLVPRYIAKIKAEDLAIYLTYDRDGKKHSVRLKPDSVLTLDPNIQRGRNDERKLLQEDSKINDIADTLLGQNNQQPRAFLGTLVWNVRDAGTDGFDVVTISSANSPVVQELRMSPTHIYLTDSAHRHLGICEAVRRFSTDPERYPSFDPKYEFVVEIYNLDTNGERLLFSELNAKQKKISAAKKKEVDTTTPIGVLKDKILDTDRSRDRLFDQNIEVNSNKNNRHTLMTMSVFANSINDMFSTSLVKESKDDDDLREELAAYFCDFFYALRDTITIKIKQRGREQEINPFKSLYLEHIDPAEDRLTDELTEEAYEGILDEARKRAAKINSEIRSQDGILSNPVVRALAYIGGQVRQMSDWERAVRKLQNDVIASKGGHLFQASNEEMLQPQFDLQHPIGSLTEDGRLNIQVQTHTINTVKAFLMKKLELDLSPILSIENSEEHWLDAEIGTDFSHTHIVHEAEESYLNTRISFFVGDKMDLSEANVRLRIKSHLPTGSWRAAEFTGQRMKFPEEVSRATGYEHSVYGSSITRYDAEFMIDLPPFDGPSHNDFKLEFTFNFPSLSGQPTSANVFLPCKVSRSHG